MAKNQLDDGAAGNMAVSRAAPHATPRNTGHLRQSRLEQQNGLGFNS